MCVRRKEECGWQDRPQNTAVPPAGEGSGETVEYYNIQLSRVTERVIKPRLPTCLVICDSLKTAVDTSFQIACVRFSTVDCEAGCLITFCTHWWRQIGTTKKVLFLLELSVCSGRLASVISFRFDVFGVGSVSDYLPILAGVPDLNRSKSQTCANLARKALDFEQVAFPSDGDICRMDIRRQA